jgi:hypothetical protein
VADLGVPARGARGAVDELGPAARSDEQDEDELEVARHAHGARLKQGRGQVGASVFSWFAIVQRRKSEAEIRNQRGVGWIALGAVPRDRMRQQADLASRKAMANALRASGAWPTSSPGSAGRGQQGSERTMLSHVA